MKLYKNFILFFIVILICVKVDAQSPVNGFMQGKGKGSAVISYYTENYIRTYEAPPNSGKLVRSKVKSNIVSAFTTFGLSKEIDLQINLPYASASGETTKEILDNIGTENVKSGLQDISVYVKYNPLNFKLRKSNLSLLGAVGLSTPFGDYKIDQKYQSAVSIGSRSTQFTGLLLLHYKLDFGGFLTGAAGYSLRNNNVPNAAIVEFKTGFAGQHFYIDGYIARQISSSENALVNNQNNISAFSGSNLNYSKVGINLFVPIIKKIGVAAGVSSYLNGSSSGEKGGYGALIYTF